MESDVCLNRFCSIYRVNVMLSKYRVKWRGKNIGLEDFIIRQRFSIQPRRCLASYSRLIPCSVPASEIPWIINKH